MRMTNTPQLSDCCNAPVREVFLYDTDFTGNECTACQEPCDVFVEEKGDTQQFCTCELPTSDFELSDGTLCCCKCEKQLNQISTLLQQAKQEAYKEGYIQGGLDNIK